MPFNHYAKIKRILESTDTEWYIRRIDEATTSKNFKGETRHFDYYYRIYDANGQPIPYCKFQQIDLFAKIMNVDVQDLVVHSDERS